MKKLIVFFAKTMVAVMLAMGMMMGAIALGWSGSAVLSVYFFGAIAVALALGLFDVEEHKRAMHIGSKFKIHGSRLNKAA